MSRTSTIASARSSSSGRHGGSPTSREGDGLESPTWIQHYYRNSPPLAITKTDRLWGSVEKSQSRLDEERVCSSKDSTPNSTLSTPASSRETLLPRRPEHGNGSRSSSSSVSRPLSQSTVTDDRPPMLAHKNSSSGGIEQMSLAQRIAQDDRRDRLQKQFAKLRQEEDERLLLWRQSEPEADLRRNHVSPKPNPPIYFKERQSEKGPYTSLSEQEPRSTTPLRSSPPVYFASEEAPQLPPAVSEAPTSAVSNNTLTLAQNENHQSVFHDIDDLVNLLRSTKNPAPSPSLSNRPHLSHKPFSAPPIMPVELSAIPKRKPLSPQPTAFELSSSPSVSRPRTSLPNKSNAANIPPMPKPEPVELSAYKSVKYAGSGLADYRLHRAFVAQESKTAHLPLGEQEEASCNSDPPQAQPDLDGGQKFDISVHSR
ncbi:MAG: hypothetical protein M1827_002539 [Pycnora praestabilis]|nr:MAG: hypothetical protein M1827_002539 [Pycnora praestabilis]